MPKAIKKEKASKAKKMKVNPFVWLAIGIVIVGIILVILFGNIGKINYKGLTFYKENFGKIEVYRHTYFFFTESGQTVKYNLYIRNDPREIDSIPVEGDIIFIQDQKVYISVDPTNLTQCPTSTLAISGLVNFLTNNGVSVSGASPIPEIANETGTKYVTCETHPNSKVIIIREGNETKIDIPSANCQIIEVANCEILQATERFEVKSILDAKRIN